MTERTKQTGGKGKNENLKIEFHKKKITPPPKKSRAWAFFGIFSVLWEILSIDCPYLDIRL